MIRLLVAVGLLLAAADLQASEKRILMPQIMCTQMACVPEPGVEGCQPCNTCSFGGWQVQGAYELKINDGKKPLPACQVHNDCDAKQCQEVAAQGYIKRDTFYVTDWEKKVSQ